MALFINFSDVDAMLRIMGKLNAILWSECVTTWEFQYPPGKELKVMMILPLNNIFYSAITGLILKISQFSQYDFEVALMESLIEITHLRERTSNLYLGTF